MDWDREFAAFLTAELEGLPPPAPVAAIVLPEEDAPDEEIAEIGRAEGQFLMIEYRDARGAASQRRITVQAIRDGAGGIPVLCCYCHERRAYRQFRVDRIRTVFDTDGVVHDDVPRFLADTFGLPSTSGARSIRATVGAEPQADEDANLWPILRDALKPYATLLAALARSDGNMSEAEVWIASEHLALFAQDMGFEDLGPDEMDKLKAYLGRLSPNEDTIWASCETVLAGGNALAEAFLAAALALVDADAKRHPEEIRLLNGLSMKLTGKALVESTQGEPTRPPTTPKPKAAPESERPWMPLRNAVKPDATLLVALAQSGGRATDAELDLIVRHCLDVADVAGFTVSLSEASRIENYIRRLKPSPQTIREAVELRKANPRGIRALLDIATALTDAKGDQAPARMTLLDRIARDLSSETEAR